jgi:hypothetical protein
MYEKLIVPESLADGLIHFINSERLSTPIFQLAIHPNLLSQQSFHLTD